MRIVIILTGGRSGIDLLQSLFDGHEEISQFPGVLEFTNNFIKIFDIKSPEKIVNFFIKFNPHFFDSRLSSNSIERHDQLGIHKNDFYKVDKVKFRRSFINYFAKSNKTKLDILICLHKAYAKNHKEMSSKKIIILHIHLFELLKNYLKIFKIYNDTRILLTFRDPLVSLSSTINHWLKYREGVILTPRSLYAIFDVHFNNFNHLHFLRKKIRVVKLEKLHTKSKSTIKRICKFLKIRYSKSLLSSTYHDKKWWGDAVSGKYLDGLNPKFKNRFDNDLFNLNELLFLENKIIDVLKKYKYPIRSKINNKKDKFYLLPFSFEKKVWLKTLKKNKIKTILSSPFFFLKRVFLLSKKNIYSKKDLPNEI